MKQIIIAVIPLFLNLSFLFSQDSDCVRNAIFGNNQICLPEIDGYKECYSDSIVKQLADATEVPTN